MYTEESEDRVACTNTMATMAGEGRVTEPLAEATLQTESVGGKRVKGQRERGQEQGGGGGRGPAADEEEEEGEALPLGQVAGEHYVGQRAGDGDSDIHEQLEVGG